MAIPFSAFLPLIGQGVNAVSNLFTNKAQKNTSLEFYDRQRADALADWNRQNQYNSPQAQMQRFKEAGLSPHLIYGQTNVAPAVRSTDAKTPNYTAPQIDTQSANPILIAQQIENMKKQGSLMDAQAVKANSETDWKNVNTNLLKDTYDYKIGQESWKSNLIKAQADKAIMDTNKTEKSIALIQPQVRKLIADTNLSIEKKAQASQIITNLKTTERLLQKKIVTEDFIQSVWYGRSAQVSAQTSNTRTQEYATQELLQLKQMGVPLDVVKGALLMREPTTINKTFNKY